MSRYQKPVSHRAAAPNEMRICRRGHLDRYISYARYLLFQQGFPNVTLLAAGFANRTAQKIADILLHRIPELTVFYCWRDIEMPFLDRSGQKGYEMVQTVEIMLALPHPRPYRAPQPAYETPAKHTPRNSKQQSIADRDRTKHRRPEGLRRQAAEGPEPAQGGRRSQECVGQGVEGATASAARLWATCWRRSEVRCCGEGSVFKVCLLGSATLSRTGEGRCRREVGGLDHGGTRGRTRAN